MMANPRLVMVVVAVTFALYWSGVLQATTKTALSFLLMRFASIRIERQPAMSKAEAVGDNIDDALEQNQKNMENRLMDVVNMMENLVTSNELDTMSNSDLEDTFGKLYEMFPLMDKVFAKALEFEAGISINPRADYHETHRRYEAIRKILDRKRTEKMNKLGGAKAVNEEEEEEEEEEIRVEEEL